MRKCSRISLKRKDIPVLDSTIVMAGKARRSGVKPSGQQRSPAEISIRGKSSWFHSNLAHICLAAILLVTLFNSLRAVDFGHHWDENLTLSLAERSLESHRFLPGVYNYPATIYWMTLSASLFAKSAPDSGAVSPPTAALFAGNFLEDPNHAFRLVVRTIFVLVTFLSVIWTYLLVLAWRKKPWEAVVASALIALSWEIDYHARWLASDAVMMQFAALTMMFLVFASVKSSKSWLWVALSAAGAGVAASTKYPGGLLILGPLLFLLPGIWKRETRLRTVAGMVLAVVIFFAAFIIITPGAILENNAFMQGIQMQKQVYGTGWGGYSAQPGVECSSLIFHYIGLVMLSRYAPIAALFSLFALVGAVTVVVRYRWTGVIFVVIPLLYLFYMGTQAVLIVRNLLILAPFLAVLAAIGFGEIIDRLRGRSMKVAFALLVTACLAANLYWQFVSASSIVNRHQVDTRQELITYLRAHPGTHFVLSEEVATRLSLSKTELPSNVTNEPADEAVVVFFASEIKNWAAFPLNRSGTYTLLPSGPYEVNLDYYAWTGDDRVMMIGANNDLSQSVYLHAF